MWSRTCEVQVDAASYDHFKYRWSALGRTPRLSDLRRIMVQKLNNRHLFANYGLFNGGQYGMRVFDGHDRYLVQNEKFLLKTKDGQSFYAQDIGNAPNTQLFEQLRADQNKLQREIEAQIEFRRTQTLESQKLQREIESQMKTEYARLRSDNVQHAIDSSYELILTQKCKFDEKKKVLARMNRKYQKLYKKVRKEYERLQQLHFDVWEDPNVKQLVLLGKTGDGKSTFGNRICGDTSSIGNQGPFRSSNNVQSVTQEIQKHVIEFEVGDEKIAVVDTPGVFDSNAADYQNAIDLIKYLKGCGGVNTFVVVGKPPRLDSAFQSMLTNLSIMLGKEFWKHLVFVITHCNVSSVEDEESSMEDEEEVNDDNKEPEPEQNLCGDLTPAQWLEEFALIVRGKLNLPGTPICIGVENRNQNSYTEAVAQLMSQVKQTKFECDRIKSPFDADKKQLQSMYDEIQTEIHSLRQTKQIMMFIEKRITKHTRELQADNQDYRPSFNRLSVSQMTALDQFDFKDLSMIDREDDESKYEVEPEYIEFEISGDSVGRSCIENNVAQSSNAIRSDTEFMSLGASPLNSVVCAQIDEELESDDMDVVSNMIQEKMVIGKQEMAKRIHDNKNNNDNDQKYNDSDNVSRIDNDIGNDNDLVCYFRDLGFAQYINNFRNNGFNTLDDLKEFAQEITDEDLRQMNILKLLHRKKLLKVIRQLNNHVAKKYEEEGADTNFLH
eukprot:38715_1